MGEVERCVRSEFERLVQAVAVVTGSVPAAQDAVLEALAGRGSERRKASSSFTWRGGSSPLLSTWRLGPAAPEHRETSTDQARIASDRRPRRSCARRSRPRRRCAPAPATSGCGAPLPPGPRRGDGRHAARRLGRNDQDRIVSSVGEARGDAHRPGGRSRMSSDLLDEEIRGALHRAATSRAVPSVGDPIAIVRDRVRQRRRRRRSLSGAAAVAAAAVAAIVVITVVSARPESSSRVRAGEEPPAATPSPGSDVQILDPGPLSPRANAAVAWTGASLFVWGGNSPKVDLGRQMKDGATYDPRSNRWRMLSVSPFPASYDPPVAVATPDEVVVAAGARRRVLALQDQHMDTA